MRMKFTNYVSLAAGIGLLAVTLGLANPQWVRAEATKLQDVLVTNTAANPVPTAAQGITSVAVTGTAAVSAAQSGPWSVTLANPRPQIVQFAVGLDCFNGGCAQRDSYVVPDGKRLVVEYVTFNGQGEVSNPYSLFFIAKVGNAGSTFLYVPTTHLTGANNGFGAVNASALVKFYADGGTSVSAQIYGEPGNVTPSGIMSISGHLEDM